MINQREKQYIIIPDSFKGTMDAITVCNGISEAIKTLEPGAGIVNIPVADGGEGTVDCLIHALGGEKRAVTVTGPYGKKLESFYGFFGEFAVVEMAAAASFAMGEKHDPSITTTYGVGELIKHAINHGCRKIILGTGGSCTNDGGAGMAVAMGAVFYNSEGQSFLPTGTNLNDIKDIDARDLEDLIRDVHIEVMSDVNNELYGPNGAAYIFAGQKGADEKMIKTLDNNLKYYAEILYQKLGRDVAHISGAGTAGGMGAGAAAFLGAKICSGIEVVLDLVKFDAKAANCDMIITGEGKLDMQSLNGKVVIEIARKARSLSIPAVAVVGCMEGQRERFLEEGLSDIWEIMPQRGYSRKPDYKEELKRTVLENLEKNRR